MEEFKIGDVLVCIDDDSEDIDFGASGHVLRGNRELSLRKEYTIYDFDYRHVPENKGTWTEEEYPGVRNYWTLVWLKDVNDPQWLHHFKKKD